MSDDDDYKDELPLISVHLNALDSDEFSMPPADVIASQRAREEECEEELRQLRLQYDQQSTDPMCELTNSDSNSTESEQSLAEAVGALAVEAPCAESGPAAVDVVANLASALTRYDTDFLSSYLEILLSRNNIIISEATNEMMFNIENAIIDTLETGCVRSESEIVVLVSLLCAATVWEAPRLPSARKLLHAMLAMATTQQAAAAGRAVGAALGAAGGAGALVQAADAARGAPPPHAALAHHLLAAALQRLAPAPDLAARAASTPSETYADELDIEAVSARLTSVWRGLSATHRHAALQVLGRAHWPSGSEAGDSGEGGGAESKARDAVRSLLSLVAQPPPAQHRHSPEHLKILVGASKLQILFRVNP